MAAAITVYLRFALGEKPREVPLVTAGKQFSIGQQNARKVVTGKLYDTKGIRVKNIFKKTRRAYPNDPIDWDAELANSSNITEEEVIYEFYYKEGENASLPMVGKPIKSRDLKAVSGLLEWTPNFLRSSDDITPKLRVMFNQSQPFENQVLSKVSSKEARKAIYKQVGIETVSACQWMAEQAQVKPLTIDTSTGSIEKMELGSPMAKMRKVTSDSEFVAFVNHTIQLALDLTIYPTIWAVLSILLETQDVNTSYVQVMHDYYNECYNTEMEEYMTQLEQAAERSKNNMCNTTLDGVSAYT